MTQKQGKGLFRGLQDYLSSLKSPVLLGIVGTLFLLDTFVFVLDPIPFVDEIILFILTILLSRWKKRDPTPPKPPPKNVTPQAPHQ